MNQREALVKYLRRNKTGITVWTAMQDLGIARLSERVRELEADGYEFHRHTLTGEGGVRHHGSRISLYFVTLTGCP